MAKKQPSRFVASPKLVRLLENKWAAPVMAELHRGTAGVPAKLGGGAKFVTLLKRLGVGPDALSRTLTGLVLQGWVVRNAGYGHPLRPEYLLSKAGIALASAASALLEDMDGLGDEARAALLRKWSLPIALALAASGGSGRFNDIKDALPGVTARALALTLKELEAAGMVERRIVEEYPLRAAYTLPRGTKKLVASLRRLEEAVAA